MLAGLVIGLILLQFRVLDLLAKKTKYHGN